MNKDDFKDQKQRAAYFQPKDGRPSDIAIIASVGEMVAFVGPHALPDDPFLTNDICLSIRRYYPDQGVYLGHRVSHLEKEAQLPIRRIDTRNNRAIYSIVI